MAWIDGELDDTIVVHAPYDDVLRFFQSPDLFRQGFKTMDHYEELEGNVWRWILQEKSAKGMTFQGDYKVRYTPTEDGLVWESLDEGNMRSEGRTIVQALGDGSTQVHYVEKLRTDLPIPKIMAKVFRPLVAREVTRSIMRFLENSKAILEG